MFTNTEYCCCFKDIYFVICGIIIDFTDKGQFQYLTNLKGHQEGTYLYTKQFLSLDKDQYFITKYLIPSWDHFIAPCEEVIITS